MDEHIPFNRPYFAGSEFTYIQNALRANHASGDGSYTKKCHEFLERSLGTPKALLTTNCTHALEMAALLLDIQPGDEVIIPSFTFVSTANAFALRGAKIVFADIRPDTLNLDEMQLEKLITPRTKAIVPVHYAGVACEMDTILAVAEAHGIRVVEDNAHGLFGKYKGEFLGTLGALGTQSFHETKNFSCGEGGALLINDKQFIERAEILREKGTNRSRFFRGQVDKYSWVDLGSSYLPSDILAAFLFAQLESFQDIQTKRKEIWTRYHAELGAWAQKHGVRVPTVPEHVDPSYHLFYLVFPEPSQRDGLIAHLKEKNINSVFHYLPLHSSEMGLKGGRKKEDCPVTEKVSECLVRLPFYNAITEKALGRVIDGVRSFGKTATRSIHTGASTVTPKKVAIVQSNYIPWKGYFDLINSVDEFILYDDVQYTKRDWRNRNLIKTAQGPQWLSIPIEVKGNRFQAIKDAKVSSSNWGEKHWNSLTAAYGRAPYFKDYRAIFEPLYRQPASEFLSEINRSFIQAILAVLGIRTKISFSMDYAFEKGEKNQQLINLCELAGATEYLSGPAAGSYLDNQAFLQAGLALRLFDYTGYPEYSQAHPPFAHGVTVLDLIFNVGPNATAFMKSFGTSVTASKIQPELQA